jgi:hypothetical protein
MIMPTNSTLGTPVVDAEPMKMSISSAAAGHDAASRSGAIQRAADRNEVERIIVNSPTG